MIADCDPIKKKLSLIWLAITHALTIYYHFRPPQQLPQNRTTKMVHIATAVTVKSLVPEVKPSPPFHGIIRKCENGYGFYSPRKSGKISRKVTDVATHRPHLLPQTKAISLRKSTISNINTININMHATLNPINNSNPKELHQPHHQLHQIWDPPSQKSVKNPMVHPDKPLLSVMSKRRRL